MAAEVVEHVARGDVPHDRAAVVVRRGDLRTGGVPRDRVQAALPLGIGEAARRRGPLQVVDVHVVAGQVRCGL